jgi:hypothetical protein
MTDLLAEIPRWVTNLAFWIALLGMLGCCYGVHRSFKGARADIDRALDDLYATLDALHTEQGTPASPLSAPVSASGNVVDIPTTQTAVARTDEAVEGLKATIGLPTDPNKVPHQPPAPTEQIPLIDPGHIGGSVGDDSWAYVLNPDHKLEHVDGHTIPAFRDPDDTPTPEQLESPTNPDLRAVPGLHLAGATRLIPTGRHRHPEDDT